MPETALIVIDMLNPYDHEDADKLVESVREALPKIVELRDRAHASDEVLLVYVNDNYEQWSETRDDLVRTAMEGEHPELVEPIKPGDESLFVVKARHSIFYQTPLEYLLSQEEVDGVILTGQVTEQCILYSALDAYIRHLEVRVPPDAVAHIHEDLAQAALQMMERNMSADLTPARG
jgi:nicotinamidase-related amidase